MIKRMTWFVGGAVAGVAGMSVAKRKMKQAATHLAPRNVIHGATDRVRDAFSDGRRAMRAKETELRARLDGRATTLADDLDDGDEVLVDGRPVAPGQVIVLKQVRDQSDDRRRRRA
jgi:hypothetical protein